MGIQPAAAVSRLRPYFLDLATNTRLRRSAAALARTTANFAPRLGACLALAQGWPDRAAHRRRPLLRFQHEHRHRHPERRSPEHLQSSAVPSTRPLFSAQLTFGFMPDLRLPRIGQWNVSIGARLRHARRASRSATSAPPARRLIRREVGGAGSTFTRSVALTTNHGDLELPRPAGAVPAECRARPPVAGLLHLVAFASTTIRATRSCCGRRPAPATAAPPISTCATRSPRPSTYELPRLHGLVGGRHLSRAHRLSDHRAAERTVSGHHSVNAFRPDLVYGAAALAIEPRRSPGGRAPEPGCFTPTAPRGKQGTLGRNVLGGFGMSQLDLAVRREFRLTEHRRLHLRLEAYNALNQANFGDPVALPEQPGIRAVHLHAEYDARHRQPRQRPRPDSPDRRPRDRCRGRPLSVLSPGSLLDHERVQVHEFSAGGRLMLTGDFDDCQVLPGTHGEFLRLLPLHLRRVQVDLP